MAFLVYYPGGTTNEEYETYVRLLRKTRNDLGHLPRVPEPETGRRWLRVWDTRTEAQRL